MTNQNRKWKPLLLVLPAFIVFLIFFVGPMIHLIILSFRPEADSNHWTIGNYLQMFTDGFILQVLWRTIKVSLAGTLIDIVLAYPLALLVLRSSPKWRAVFTMLILSPLLVSGVVRSFGWMILLSPGGVINNILMQLHIISEPIKMLYTESSIIIGLAHIHLPHVVIAIMTALYAMDPRLESAASSLGSSPLTTFRRITFPLSLPGVISGGMLAFSLNMSSFVTPGILGGPRHKVLSTLAYQETVTLFNWPMGAAISMLLLLFSTLLVSIYQKMTNSSLEKGAAY